MNVTSLERLRTTLRHEQPDRVCLDLGATPVTGISVFALSRLRRAVLGETEYRVKVIEPYQMLGEVDDALADALGVDVVNVGSNSTMFGFENKDWKPLTLHDGIEVMVPGQFNFTEDAEGNWLMHPEGDLSVPPSGRMPKGGFFFDAIPRQPPLDESRLDPADNLEDFGSLSEEQVQHYVNQARQAEHRRKGAVLMVPGTGFGDIALVPATWRKHTCGIRDIEEWYVSTVTRRDYVLKVFEGQCQIALKNLERLIQAVGDSVQVGYVTGTDFGTQRGSFISRKAYKELYQPFHKTINEVIHRRTSWKTFIHSCGGVWDLIPDFIESGFDILNPVQCSAAGMGAVRLKSEFGRDLVFWGGGVDTQRTLCFGTADEVYREVRDRIAIFNRGGGFVFNTVHNVQALTPVENLLAMFKAIRDSV
ncbi:MAG TPA: uroporphyrinogen decarboxylase family protein [Candidatus Paceibacterota bacterium]|nr:uroporphyrinogen decarboxylase family protein [Verrucomicrobiota bacterium]HRY48770.1 uroporphyrinogen decarboxylase family protein [Candidatus Paceibacterota bacterium]HSA00899.1 uroporphyrinogen decarboxylase family protein [Candidatus Paceibacterota bacterium]